MAQEVTALQSEAKREGEKKAFLCFCRKPRKCKKNDTEVELFQKNTEHCLSTKDPALKYGKGITMIWAWVTASGPGPFAIIEGEMNS